MSPAARTVVSMQLSQLVQASKLCHRRAAARPLSRTSDKPSRPCLATTASFSRPLNVKRCLPEAPASNDVYLTRHQAWITCQNLPGFSLRGQRSYVELLRGGGRAWALGTRLDRRSVICVRIYRYGNLYAVRYRPGAQYDDVTRAAWRRRRAGYNKPHLQTLRKNGNTSLMQAEMEKKKERSSKQKLRVEVGQEAGEEDGNLLLANPMAGGEVSPHATVSQNDHFQPRAAHAKKNRPKSPSLLRFFVRGTRKASEDLEDSLCSDHEDGLSVSQYRVKICNS